MQKVLLRAFAVIMLLACGTPSGTQADEAGVVETQAERADCEARLFAVDEDSVASSNLATEGSRSDLALHYESEGFSAMASLFRAAETGSKPMERTPCIDWKCVDYGESSQESVPPSSTGEVDQLRSFIDQMGHRLAETPKSCWVQINWALGVLRIEQTAPFTVSNAEFERALRTTVTAAVEGNKVSPEVLGPAGALEESAYALAARGDLETAAAVLDRAYIEADDPEFGIEMREHLRMRAQQFRDAMKERK